MAAWAIRAWKQPQQLWVRKACFQVHLWAGLLLALYVIAIGISGSILVFKDELTPRPHAAVMPFDATQCTPPRLIAAINAALKAHPGLTPSLASCPIEANPLYAINLHYPPLSPLSNKSLTIYVHPQSGQVIGQLSQQSTWIDFVERFHIDLLLTRNGRQWNGLAAAILLLLVITGLVLWWPGVRNWRRSLKVDFQRTWKRINWDLHSAISIWTVLFTLTWAVTGIYFAWQTPFERWINRISPIVTASYPEAEMDRLTTRPHAHPNQSLTLQHVLEQALTSTSSGQLEGVFYGTGPNAILTVYIARAHLGDYASTDFYYFDQQTGQLLYSWHRGQNKTLGDWLLWLMVPLHFGTSWGFLGKILWCTLGLVFPLLAVTGFLMYWNRWLRKALNPLTVRSKRTIAL